MVKEGGKIEGSVRAVPMRAVVVEALDLHRKRLLEAAVANSQRSQIESPVLFPAPRGGYTDLEKFRHREWTPAFRAAGIEHRPVKAIRHTFASWAIESGKVELSYLARLMGTSVRELEDTYFRWLKRTDEQLRAALDEYDAAVNAG
jgi:integrase